MAIRQLRSAVRTNNLSYFAEINHVKQKRTEFITVRACSAYSR